jgi:hypothetical protein
MSRFKGQFLQSNGALKSFDSGGMLLLAFPQTQNPIFKNAVEIFDSTLRQECGSRASLVFRKTVFSLKSA